MISSAVPNCLLSLEKSCCILFVVQGVAAKGQRSAEIVYQVGSEPSTVPDNAVGCRSLDYLFIAQVPDTTQCPYQLLTCIGRIASPCSTEQPKHRATAGDLLGCFNLPLANTGPDPRGHQ